MRGMEQYDERGNAAMMGNLVMAAPAVVRYQTVCSLIKDESRDYMTYCNLHRPAATEAQPQRPPCPVRTAT